MLQSHYKVHCGLFSPFVTAVIIPVTFSDSLPYPSDLFSSLSSNYCKARKFSWDKFSWISPSKIVHALNFHYSMVVLFYIITKVLNNTGFFNVHGLASSAEITKMNPWWNFLVLQYFCDCHPSCIVWLSSICRPLSGDI